MSYVIMWKCVVPPVLMGAHGQWNLSYDSHSEYYLLPLSNTPFLHMKVIVFFHRVTYFRIHPLIQPTSK